jgi:hypothetical protein
MPNDIKEILKMCWRLEGVEQIKDPDRIKYFLYHKVVENLFNQVKIKRMLEIGPWDGGVFKTILEKSKNRPDQITMIDSWGEDFLGCKFRDYSHIEKIAKDFDYKGGLEGITGNSHGILPKLIEDGRKYDLILVDGDHSYWGEWLDIVGSWPLLDDFGIMIVDDVHNKNIPWVGYASVKFFEEIGWRQGYFHRDFGMEEQPGCHMFIKLL